MRHISLTRTIWVLGTICLIVALAWAGDRDRGGRHEAREAPGDRAPHAARPWSHAEKAAPEPSDSPGRAPRDTTPSWQPREEWSEPASRGETWRWREREDWTPTFRSQADRAWGTPREADTGWTPAWSLPFGRGEQPDGERPGLGPQREQHRTESGFGQRTEPTPGQREEPGEGARWQKAEPGRGGDDDWAPGRSLRFGRGEEPGGERPGLGPQREQHRTESGFGQRIEPTPGQREEPGEGARWQKAEPGRGGDDDWAPGRSLRFGRSEQPDGERPSLGPQREQHRTESGFGQRTEPTPGQREEPGGGARWQKAEPGRGGDDDWAPGRSLRFGRGEEPGGERPGLGPQREQHRTESGFGQRTEPTPGQREEPDEGARWQKAEPGRGGDDDWTPGRSLRWTHRAEKAGGERSGADGPRSEAFRPEKRGADAGRTSRLGGRMPGGKPSVVRDEEAIRKLAGSPPRPGDPPRLFVNGSELRFPRPPRLHDGHPVAPLRPFVEKIGGRMWFDHRTGYWHVSHRGSVIRFRIGHRYAYCGDRLIILVVAPYVIDGYIYCPIEPFAFFFGVRYYWHYYWAPPLYYAPYISERRAIAIARDYLIDLDEYPYRVLYVEAHRQRAPANHFWEAVTSGYEPLWDAPRRLCWVVEFGYRRGHRDAWKQVFVDVHTGRVVGGWDSEYDYYADDWDW